MTSKPDFISCSALAAAGYPAIYDVLQDALKRVGWTYDIAVDGWYPPKECAIWPELPPPNAEPFQAAILRSLEKAKDSAVKDLALIQLIHQGVQETPSLVCHNMEPLVRKHLLDVQSRGNIPASDKIREANEMAAKKTLCLDFDGVIHSYTSGWNGLEAIDDPPVEGAIAFLYDALNTFKVAVYSSRSASSAGILAMQAYIAKHAAAANFDYGRPWWLQLEWPVNKPSAWVTIDDRAITFKGVWPSIQELINFRVWNTMEPSPIQGAMQAALTEAVTLLKEEKV